MDQTAYPPNQDQATDNSLLVQPASTSRGIKPVIVGILCLLVLGGGFYLGNNYQIVWTSGPIPWPTVLGTNSGNNPLDNPLFGQVQELMRTKYLRASELDQQQMLYGAIAGMVNSAGDPYTSFYDPDQNQDAQSQLSGKYEGIGAELGFNKERQLSVIAPIKGTPAEAAGIQASDIIVKIDDTDTQDMTLTEAVSLIRGEAGTEVKLTVFHPGAEESEVIAITRQQITITSVDLTFEDNPAAEGEDDDLAYLKLSRFGDTTEQEWDQAVDQILQRDAKALVLDLRNNPGGYLQTAIHIGSEFFKDGVIVGQQDASGQVQNFNVDHAGRLQNIPVVVLINQGSASASEIVSGALQARDRAEVIGVTSFGKGSVQQVIDLPNNTSLHVTIAKWLLPNGQNIDKEGIKPDSEVKIEDQDLEAQNDPQLDAALQSAGQAVK